MNYENEFTKIYKVSYGHNLRKDLEEHQSFFFPVAPFLIDTFTALAMSYHTFFLRLLSIFICIVAAFTADRPNPFCKAPGLCSGFPPGHENVGSSWWQIGQENGSVTILSFTAELRVPPAPANVTGAMVINPSLENTVSFYPKHVSTGVSLMSTMIAYRTDVYVKTVKNWSQNPAQEDFQTLAVAYPQS